MVLGIEPRVWYTPGRCPTPGLCSSWTARFQRDSHLPSGNTLVVSSFKLQKLDAETYTIIDLFKKKLSGSISDETFGEAPNRLPKSLRVGPA